MNTKYFYLASGLENASQVSAVAARLRAAGWQQTYDWTVHGSVAGTGARRIAEVAAAESKGVMEADVVVVLLPGGRGTHVELGMAVGRGIPVVLYHPDPAVFNNDTIPSDSSQRTCAFYFLPSVVRVNSLDALLPAMEASFSCATST